MQIGVISDTHGLLRPEVREILRTCDGILHGGDVSRPELLEELRTIAPVYVVRGNNDGAWAEAVPQILKFSIGDVKFCMVHNKKDLPEDLEDAQIVVFGHSHKYVEQWREGRLWLNPGSCGRRRFHQEITMALLTIEGSNFEVRKLVFQREEGGKQ